MKMESPIATGLPDSQNPENSFVWDEQSQLYFHASTGFYHDPNAGWYYSTRDGLYYKFEDGNYVLLPSHQGNSLETSHGQMGTENPSQEEPFSAVGNTECSSSDAPENHPPPSEWLEDTLIELYLSGYSNLEANAGDHDMAVYPETFVPDGNNDGHELNESTPIPEDYGAVIESSENVSDEGGSWDEENWRAQYGQVVQDAEVPIPESSLISLWDWEMVTKPRNDGKCEVPRPRLVGRLAKQSAKLHPSLQSGGGLLKTAPICEVHLDLVRVTTGQVYKLRTPSKQYLASLSTYDSSNPTKDWGFPELSDNREVLPHAKSSVRGDSKTADVMAFSRGSSSLPDAAHEKLESYQYRDRAADRRALYGGFGVGPGQKNSVDGDSDRPTPSPEEAAAEALNMSFGAGSYARKVLESMGWKEGETLGKTTKGLVEPIQAQGNIGSAGLGWPRGRLNHL